MQNGRFILYILAVAVALLTMTAIKMTLPHHEPKEPIDQVGMRLYRPIFFADNNETPQIASIQEGFKDSEIEESKEETVKESVPEKVEAKKPKSSKSVTEGYFQEMVKTYKSTTLKERKYRNDVVVRYYRHEPDGERAQVLVDYGFYLHERPVSNKKEFENVMSNVIYYGHDFPESDLKLITYLLIKNGIEIKEIRKFKDFDGWKHKAIEIGASKYLVDEPTLTLEEIQSISIPN